jgi:antibiotic biosynthesis monooxygenase (ABM) superfamily enzyme
MRWRDKILLSFLVWVFVYPGVLLVTWAFDWIGFSPPRWIEIGISTALTVPLISIVAVPLVERIVAATRDETVAEMKVTEARGAPGPDPEQIVTR